MQRLSLEEARQLAAVMMGESAALELTELFLCVPLPLSLLSSVSPSLPESGVPDWLVCAIRLAVDSPKFRKGRSARAR